MVIKGNNKYMSRNGSTTTKGPKKSQDEKVLGPDPDAKAQQELRGTVDRREEVLRLSRRYDREGSGRPHSEALRQSVGQEERHHQPRGRENQADENRSGEKAAPQRGFKKDQPETDKGLQRNLDSAKKGLAGSGLATTTPRGAEIRIPKSRFEKDDRRFTSRKPPRRQTPKLARKKLRRIARGPIHPNQRRENNRTTKKGADDTASYTPGKTRTTRLAGKDDPPTPTRFGKTPYEAEERKRFPPILQGELAKLLRIGKGR